MRVKHGALDSLSRSLCHVCIHCEYHLSTAASKGWPMLNERHPWNKIDSFIHGNGQGSIPDPFLQSKGWSVDMCVRKDRSSKWITVTKRWLLYVLHGFRCAYCNRTLPELNEEGILLTLDHLVPIERGGSNHSSNLVTACRSCNSAKNGLTYRTFLAVLRDHGVDTAPIVRRVARMRKWGQRLEDRNLPITISNDHVLEIRRAMIQFVIGGTS